MPRISIPVPLLLCFTTATRDGHRLGDELCVDDVGVRGVDGHHENESKVGCKGNLIAAGKSVSSLIGVADSTMSPEARSADVGVSVVT